MVEYWMSKKNNIINVKYINNIIKTYNINVK